MHSLQNPNSEKGKRTSLSSMRTSKQVAELPMEIIFIILSLLPVKCLLRLKTVCKSWLSIISDPSFIKAHLKLAIANDTKSHIVFDKSPKNPHIFLPKVTVIDYETNGRMLFDLPFGRSCENAEILCSCNGLLLVGVGRDSHFLWNPSLRSRYLELFRRTISLDYNRHYGLCYDSSTDAYKVIRLIDVECILCTGTHANMYNCKTKSWKKIEPFPYKLFNSAQGVLVDGNPHFVVVRETKDQSEHINGDNVKKVEYVLIYFDVVEDTFKEVATPGWLNNEGSLFDLVTFDGMLCLVQHEIYNPNGRLRPFIDGAWNTSTLWVMRRSYEVGDSWTRLFTIITRSWKLLPLRYRNNYGEVMVEKDKSELATFSFSEGRYRQIFSYLSRGMSSNSSIHKQIDFKSTGYLESLVSPSDVE